MLRGGAKTDSSHRRSRTGSLATRLWISDLTPTIWPHTLTILAEVPADVQQLIDNRAAARKAKDFALADQLREELEARGYEVKDNRDGSATYQSRRA